MNVFQRAIKALSLLVGAGPGPVNPVSRALAEVKAVKTRHTIRWFSLRSGHSFFGPVGVPDQAFSHVSRQTARHYLRALWFQKMSNDNPLWSRKDRRRAARLFAKLEYRETIKDDFDPQEVALSLGVPEAIAEVA